MALPADFNKIYGSTATGGLTPIGDVNYAKGWEFVGSNPPTKNDFSYLQNLSDLKSQWLYLNKLQRGNPFGDIKSDGAVQTALGNLGLGGIASVTDIQAGTPRKLIDADGLRKYLPTQVMQISGFMRIPDIPGGTIIQWGQESRVLNEGVASVVLPTPFPNTGRFAIAIPLNTAGDYNCDLFAQLQSATNTQINFFFSWVSSSVPANGFQWLAIGY